MKFRKNNILIILLLIVITICSVIIGFKNYNYYKDNKSYENLRKTYEDIIEKDTKENNKKVSLENNMEGINSDYKIWINIPNTVIDYPVVQGDNNEFYLSNNFYKEESISGTIFVDSRNDINEDQNLVLYGHNMRNGSMFADINKFKNKEFFNNGTIKIIKGDKEHIYEVFSVLIEEADSINIKYKFSSNVEFYEYINDLKSKSIYKKDIESYSNIITLYTCSYEFENARTIVCAVEK